jgi:mRNA interferase MazF
MPSFSKNEVVLVRYPFSDLTAAKVRPAVVVNAPHPSADNLIVPLTSRVGGLQAGEFLLADWRTAGLNLPSAVKRGLYTIHDSLVLKSVGRLSARDADRIEQSLRAWLGLA